MTATTTKSFKLKELEQWAFKMPGNLFYTIFKPNPNNEDDPYTYKNVKLVGNRVIHVMSTDWVPCWISPLELRSWDKILLDTTPPPEYFIVSHKIAVMDIRFKKRMENKYG